MCTYEAGHIPTNCVCVGGDPPLSCLTSLEIAAVSMARGLVQFPTVILLECKLRGIRIMSVCLLHLLVYPRCLEWYLVHIKHSKNISCVSELTFLRIYLVENNVNNSVTNTFKLVRYSHKEIS